MNEEWTVVRSAEPLSRPHLPLSYSAFRTFRTCTLQFALLRDATFPSRTHPRARMGTALHDALEFLARDPEATPKGAISFFHDRLRQQREMSQHNYRERNLPWPRELREAMELVLASRQGSTTRAAGGSAGRTVEATLVSTDKLLLGRPDEVISTASTTVIVDYKSGGLATADLGEMEDQIHFYAALWWEVHGHWPGLGRLVFLLDSSTHEFAIDTERCRRVTDEARQIAIKLAKDEWSGKPQVGEHCVWCAYRPWCDKYWEIGPTLERSARGDLDGFICAQHSRDAKALCLKTDQHHILVVNRDVVPLPAWEPGTVVRLIGVAGEGDLRFKMPSSECFRIDGIQIVGR
jgi:hypothetical protein